MYTIKLQKILRSQQNNILSNTFQSNELRHIFDTILPLTIFNDTVEISFIGDNYNRSKNLLVNDIKKCSNFDDQTLNSVD